MPHNTPATNTEKFFIGFLALLIVFGAVSILYHIGLWIVTAPVEHRPLILWVAALLFGSFPVGSLVVKWIEKVWS